MKLARLDSDIGRAQNAYDVFVALDDAGRRVGKCSIVPYKADDLLPDCPFNIFIDCWARRWPRPRWCIAPIPSWRRACMLAARPTTAALSTC